MRQFWLVNKKNKKVALFPYTKDKEIYFKIVGNEYERIPEGFDPSKGTVARAIAICPVCGAVIDAKTTRKLFQEGKAGQRMVAVILRQKNNQSKNYSKGKKYRIATDKDIQVFKEAEVYLKEKREKLMYKWEIDPIPNENIPTPCHDVDRPPMYGMKTWGELFNVRQKLSLITFIDKIKQAYQYMIKENINKEYIKAIISYLGCIMSRLTDQSSVLVPWIAQIEAVAHTFNRQALGMVWDYIEAQPFAYFLSATKWVCRVIIHLSETSNIPAIINQFSAISLPYTDNFFDAVLTDPPYYDNVSYANLSDFFYVWLKRILGDFYPDLFSTPLTPKSSEIISDSDRCGGKEKAKIFFESMLKKSFQEIYRVLKPNGITTIVYAHKSTSGWETLINSLLDSSLVVTGAWPIHTEMVAKVKAQGTASLMSSIYIIARKMKREPTGFYNNVKEELKNHLYKKLERLWTEGISGADFFIAAIGSAIEIFGRYEKIIDYEGLCSTSNIT